MKTVFAKSFCLSDVGAIHEFCKNATTVQGAIDIWVNCAGLNNIRTSAVETLTEDIEHLLRVNLIAPVECIKAVYPAMKARGSGAIVNILSSVCLYSNLGSAAYTASKSAYTASKSAYTASKSAYTASKSALDAYLKVMRKEFKADGIRLMSVKSGGVNTDFRPQARLEYMKPEDVADTGLRLLEVSVSAHIY